MSKKVAVVCASNPGSLGMYSVDLAAVDFLSRNGIEFDLFTSHTFSRRGRYKLLLFGVDIGHRSKVRFGDLVFKRLSDISQLRTYSYVLYWGDFTPNPIYGYEDFQRWEKRRDVRSTNSESLEKWARIFNLSGGKISPYVIAAGNNFQHNYYHEHGRYEKYLSNLGSNFDLILPRDTYSVENLKEHIGVSEHHKIELGLDPAFLLKDQKLDNKHKAENFFCYRFARSKLPLSKFYIHELEKTIGCESVHLSDWDIIGSSDAHSSFECYISDIKNSLFVITDLYHLAINAIRLNVPVFCLGNPVNKQQGSLGDFKKKILFDMLNIKSYYFEIDPGEHSDNAFIHTIKRELNNYKKNLVSIYEQKEKLKKNFEERLIKALVEEK